ncbi:MAG TPA: tetratricopeptide repeat protein [Pyrinomonadaceae bacterium]
MSNSRRFSTLFFVLIACSICYAQEQQQQAGMPAASPAPSSDASRARFDELRAKGSEALYNLDYDEARRIFMDIQRQFPDSPSGPQSLAASLWLQTMNESRRLQSSLYNSKSFYAKTEDKVDPKTIQAFKEYTQQAKQIAEARLKQNPNDVEALYALGSITGLQAAFAGAVERRFMAALRNGMDSVDYHRKVLKLDPNCHDAEVTLGLYEYVLGSVSFPVRLVLKVGGMSGSKKKGIETLERVVAQGTRANDDARVLLITLYKREKRYNDALKYARELAEKYPRNYLFKLEVADALITQAVIDRKAGKDTTSSETEAFNIFDALMRELPGRPPAQRAIALDLIHYRYGESLFALGQFDRASQQFLAAAKARDAAPGLISMAYLRAGQSLDLTGKRPEAVAAYHAVLGRPDVFDMYNEAQRGLRTPYTSKELK